MAFTLYPPSTNDQRALSVYSDKIVQLSSSTQSRYTRFVSARAQVINLLAILLRNLVSQTRATVVSFKAACIRKGKFKANLADARSHGVQTIKLATALVFGSVLGMMSPRWSIDLCNRLHLISMPTRGWNLPFAPFLRTAFGLASLIGAREFLRGPRIPVPLPVASSALSTWLLGAGAVGVAIIAGLTVRAVQRAEPKVPLIKVLDLPQLSDPTIAEATKHLTALIRERCLSIDGIYRTANFSSSMLDTLTINCFKALSVNDFNGFTYLIRQAQVELLPVLLKRIIQNTKDSLVPQDKFEILKRAFTQREGEDSQVPRMRRALTVMLEGSRAPILQSLLLHLHDVAMHDKDLLATDSRATSLNQMTSGSLALVWIPTIFAETKDHKELQFTALLSMIINNQRPQTAASTTKP